MFRWLVILIFVATTAPGFSAEIQVIPLGSDEMAIVTISGKFEIQDADVFRTKTSMLTKAIVSFSSGGGAVLPAIEIGTAIRMKGFSTLVPANTYCASACAISWLGGVRRFMGKEARVGFHAVYIDNNGQKIETSVGNALVGAYANRIGLPDRAVIYITRAAPEEMTWLNLADAEKQGIDVSELNLPGASASSSLSVAPSPSPPSSPPTPSPSTETARTPEQASVRLTDEENGIAMRLARNFKKRYQEAGMAGINASISNCYERFHETSSENIGKYCIALDALAMAVDATISEQLHTAPNEFNKEATVNKRTLDEAARLHLGAQTVPWLTRGMAIAGVAAGKTAGR